MQPETAFWLLSATAQSAAALAGLSALILVFQIRIAGQGWKELETESNPTYQAMTAKAWVDIIRYSATATIAFLLAVAFSIGGLWGVELGTISVPLHVFLLTLVALSMALIGGLMMALNIATPAAFFVPALSHIAKGMTRRRLRSELRRLQAGDRARAESAKRPPEP